MLKEMIKEILREELTGNSTTDTPKSEALQSCMVGKYVVVRSRNEGINAGYVVVADSTGIVLRDARRLWYHKPIKKEVSWYEGVAEYGISEQSKLSCKVNTKVIVEDYSMVLCSDAARETIEKGASHEQS